MLFPNPDKKDENSLSTEGNRINSAQAGKHFSSIMEHGCNYNLHKKFYNVLRESFLEVFDELEDFKEDEEEQINENEIPQIQSQNNIRTAEELNDIAVVNEAVNLDGKSLKFSSTKRQTKASNKIKNKNTPKLKIIRGGRFFKFEELNEIENEEKQQQEIQESKTIEEENEVAGKTKKPKTRKWIKTDNKTLDYLTLIRQTVNVTLAYHGIVTREFISTNENLIITVCYIPSMNLTKLAELMGIQKKVNLSVVDLMALEPVDTKNRPLRMNVLLWNHEKWDQFYCSKTGQKDKYNKSISRVIQDFHENESIEKKSHLTDENQNVNCEFRGKVKVNEIINFSIHKNANNENSNKKFDVSQVPTAQNTHIEWQKNEFDMSQLRVKICKLLESINYRKVIRQSFGTIEKKDFMTEFVY